MVRTPFQMVEISPWPLTSAVSAFFLAMGFIDWFHFHNLNLTFVALFFIALSMYQWWRDIIRESTFMGKHTSVEQQSIRLGVLLFILSEICFFLAFFWAFFHASLSPSHALGCEWPPMGVAPVDPLAVPLLNTVILLASGITVTWSHHSLISGEKKSAGRTLFLTVILGFYFTYLQWMEYKTTTFTIADSVYGSVFFVTTGFHSLHVIIGSMFLLVTLLCLIKDHYSSLDHISLDTAAWYWHFVDVVWICVYIFIYIWTNA